MTAQVPQRVPGGGSTTAARPARTLVFTFMVMTPCVENSVTHRTTIWPTPCWPGSGAASGAATIRRGRRRRIVGDRRAARAHVGLHFHGDDSLLENSVTHRT